MTKDPKRLVMKEKMNLDDAMKVTDFIAFHFWTLKTLFVYNKAKLMNGINYAF